MAELMVPVSMYDQVSGDLRKAQMEIADLKAQLERERIRTSDESTARYIKYYQGLHRKAEDKIREIQNGLAPERKAIAAELKRRDDLKNDVEQALRRLQYEYAKFAVKYKDLRARCNKAISKNKHHTKRTQSDCLTWKDGKCHCSVESLTNLIRQREDNLRWVFSQDACQEVLETGEAL